MKRRRVKITGIGPVTPAGIGRAEFWKGILEPVSRVRHYKRLPEEHGPFVAAYIDRFQISDYVNRTLPSGIARHAAFAVAAASLALDDANISAGELGAATSAVVIGSGYMDFAALDLNGDGAMSRSTRAQRRVAYTMDIGGVPVVVAQMLDVHARTLAFSTQCVAGMDAIGHAADLVASGEVEVAICGGTDAPLNRFPLLELRAAGLTPMAGDMPERLCRPFDRWRTTGVISEGACMIVLEPESSPRPGYAFVRGYAYANDRLNEPCSGLTESTRLALAAARFRPADIEAISAWGPGHLLIDASEAAVMHTIFNSRLSDVPAASIKAAIGSPVGAAPAIQVAAAALSLRHGVLPPTVNWDYPDPECALNLSNRERLVDHSVTLVNAHGLCGLNASLVLQRCSA